MLNVLEISRYRDRQFKKLFNNDDNIMQKLELIPSLIRMLPDIRDKSQTACYNAAFKKTYKLSENDNVREIFNSISERQSWGGGKETVSGMGSQMISTKTLRSCLGRWISKYDIHKIVDFPCGDCNWQHAIPGIENIQYFGFDISENSIKRAKEKNPYWTFREMDITSTVPPEADLIIIRDCIQHLPLEMGKRAIANACKSNSTWLGISTYDKVQQNKVISIGGYYPNNLLKPPFNFPDPKEECDNYFGAENLMHPNSKFYLMNITEINKFL